MKKVENKFMRFWSAQHQNEKHVADASLYSSDFHRSNYKENIKDRTTFYRAVLNENPEGGGTRRLFPVVDYTERLCPKGVRNFIRL